MTRQKFAGWLRRMSPVLCLALIAGVVIYAAPQAGGYHVIKRMPVGGDGGWDYMTVDSDSHRLYVARGSHFMVVDDTTGKVLGDIEIANSKNSHGLTLALDLGEGFTSNGDANTVSVVDLKTLKATSVIPIPGKDPDSIRYDAATKRIFTFNGKSNDSTVIDATSKKVIGTVKLAGKPEEAILDGNGNMFVNIEDKSSIQEFDTKSYAIKGTWPLAPCEGPSAMAFDSAHRRIFVACDKVMVVVNADNGKVVASRRLAAIRMATASIRVRGLPSPLAAKAWSPSFTRTLQINILSSGISTPNLEPARWRWTPRRIASTRRPRISNPRGRQHRIIRSRVPR